MTSTRSLPAVAAAALAALALAGCGGKGDKAAADTTPPRTVSVVQVEARALTGAASASGPLIPREEAAVLPEVTGYRVARVLVEEGAYVQAGQTLVELDPALINAQVEQQAALAAQARVQAEQAKAEAARVAGLDGQGVLSQEQLDQRRFSARSAQATAEAQAAALKDLRTRQGKLAVTSPVSGLVLERTVRPGDLAAAGSTPWFRIARDGQVELNAQLGARDLMRTRPGQPVDVALADGSKVQGVVRIVSPAVNADTQLGSVRVSLPVRPDIRSGGFASATLAGASAPAPTVPETAVRFDADGASVMVVGADNRVRQAKVRTGMRAGGFVELVSGPPVGSWVLEKAASLVLPNDLVKPVRSQAGAGKAAARPAPKTPAAK